MTTLPTHTASRVIRRDRRGSSSPVVVDTNDGPRFVKLTGASQGTPPLVAEIIVAALAEAIGLSSPARDLTVLPAGIASDDPNDELRDLLDASAGVNLGFTLLEGARDLTASEFSTIDVVRAARVLWLDTLVQNLDRTPRNANLMMRRGTLWLIDHGACLPWQHDWSTVTELSPQRTYDQSMHVFAWAAPVFAEVHAECAPRLTRAVLADAAAQVPDAWLGANPERRRAAHAAFLWKRLTHLSRVDFAA